MILGFAVRGFEYEIMGKEICSKLYFTISIDITRTVVEHKSLGFPHLVLVFNII